MVSCNGNHPSTEVAEYSNIFETTTTSIYCAKCYCNWGLAEVLFEFCNDCNKMSSLPQGAFAAYKIRAQTDKQMAMAKVQSSSTKQPPDNFIFPNKKLMDWSPLKYNSKLMNAIWGNYNRYSPHNIKSNDGDANHGCGNQASAQ